LKFLLTRLAVVACLLFGLSATAQPVRLSIVGSTTLYPLSQQLAAAYQRSQANTNISVASGGSARGISALLSGSADIANSSRFINEAELDAARLAGIYPVPFRIADDCIIPIVHKRNKLKNLSSEQLRHIFSGDIRNWRELGGSDRPIKVITRHPDSGTFGVWRDLVMAGDEVRTDATRVAANSDMVRAVSVQPEAIGYIALGHLSAGIKPLRVDGVMGSMHSVRDGSYSLSRPLFMFTRGWPQGTLLDFINFALDPARGQDIVRHSGFVPVHSGSR
jgi:phosphate transport system substrate-binding protein